MKAITIELDVNNNVGAFTKSLWNHVKQIELKIANQEGTKIKFPAIYGLAAITLLPTLSLATIYSLVNADLKISIEKGN